MKYPLPTMTPEEIRAIRKRLGLSQAKAGEVIGGGPRAFNKYESGTIKPTSGVVNLLRVLDDNPSALGSLPGSKGIAPVIGNHPFEVSSAEIEALTEETFPLLLKRLLSAEAQTNDLPASTRIHVSTNIHAKDGGEDGRITWTGGPASTGFLPSRFSQFQMKAGRIAPARSAKDVLVNQSEAKGMIREALETGGSYVMLCSHPYAQKQIDDRKGKIRAAIRKAGVTVGDDQIDFRDADQLAMWVNSHPSVAVWWKEHVQPGSIGPFRSWFHWAGHPKHEHLLFVEDERFAVIRAFLNERVTEVRSIVRVVGLPGVGKSRLTLEALSPTDEDVLRGTYLSDTVMYVDQSESSPELVRSTVQNLADLGRRAIVVVDSCDPETRVALSGMVLRQNSRMSLIVIEDGNPATAVDENSIGVEKASSSVIEAIVDHISPDLPFEDRQRLLQFSEGLPNVAHRVALKWGTQASITDDEDALVDAYILGRNVYNRALLNSAELLSVFGAVDVDSPGDNQLADIAALGGNITTDNLYADISDLVNQGVVQRHGRYATLKPLMVTFSLAARQWRRWSRIKWEQVLAGDVDSKLKVSAARQLALLNTTDVARSVVEHLCRVNGPFDDMQSLSLPGHAEILSSFAEVSPEDVTCLIERHLDSIDDLSKMDGLVRRQFVSALQKIAMHRDSFEDAALLLLRLADNDNELWLDNATEQFVALFPMSLGGTAADGTSRLDLVDEVIDTVNSQQRVVVAKALIEGIETSHFSRTIGAESQGTLPAIRTWEPATTHEAVAYIAGCIGRLGNLALEDSEVGIVARAGLSNSMDSLILHGFIESVAEIVDSVGQALGYWPEAVRTLQFLLHHRSSGLDDEIIGRITSLISQMQPRTIEERLDTIIRESWWETTTPDGSARTSDALYQSRMDAARALATEFMCEPGLLQDALHRLTCGQQGMTDMFGAAIAEIAEAPLDWLSSIEQATSTATEDVRNYELLIGFISGLQSLYAGEVEAFKVRAAATPELAPAIPQICSRLGVTASDVELAIEALRSGRLPPRRLRSWGGALEGVPRNTVGQLFDALIDHSAEGFILACTMMGVYGYDNIARLGEFDAQVVRLAENTGQWSGSSHRTTPGQQIAEHHFEQIMKWMLCKGRDDPSAGATALALAKHLVGMTDLRDVETIRALLPIMLADFPEIVWPLLGDAIATDDRRGFRLKHLLGSSSSGRGKDNPVILHLPAVSLLAWCHAHPKHAPAFLASALPIQHTLQSEHPGDAIHPMMLRLISEFGDRQDVRQATISNMFSNTWIGSMESHLSPYLPMLDELRRHAKPKVRGWARNVQTQLRKSIDHARQFDAELNIR